MPWAASLAHLCQVSPVGFVWGLCEPCTGSALTQGGEHRITPSLHPDPSMGLYELLELHHKDVGHYKTFGTRGTDVN